MISNFFNFFVPISHSEIEGGQHFSSLHSRAGIVV